MLNKASTGRCSRLIRRGDCCRAEHLSIRHSRSRGFHFLLYLPHRFRISLEKL